MNYLTDNQRIVLLEEEVERLNGRRGSDECG